MINKKFSYYIYVISNNINGKQYVGSRKAYIGKPEDDMSYMGSSKYLNEDYKNKKLVE
jgi:hypothetical protein